MNARGTLRIATRGSDLALRQAAIVEEALSGRRVDVELVEVETRGDQIRDELIHRLGKTGAFVRALDETVLDGEADAAVHSMKDMPTELPEEMVVAGVPERAPAGDVLVTPEGSGLSDLSRGATVGTSSIRRRAQLLNARPELSVEPLRGNVDTRVEKLLAPSLQREHEARVDAERPGTGAESSDDDREFERSAEEWFADLSEIQRRALERDADAEYDAVVLAEAGLERSGLAHHVATERLPRGRFVSAPGQGAIAVTAADGEAIEAIRNAVDHPRTRVETTVERTVLAELGGGCVAPIGVYALLQGSRVSARAQVLSADGEEVIEASRDLPVDDHARAAAEFAADLRERGAAELIERATSDGSGDGATRENDESAGDVGGDDE